jgi:hypothetical protein
MVTITKVAACFIVVPESINMVILDKIYSSVSQRGFRKTLGFHRTLLGVPKEVVG